MTYIRRAAASHTIVLSLRVLLLAAAVLMGPVAEAQLSTAVLNGTVFDPSGAPVPDAKIRLSSTTETASRETLTNSAGDFVIPAIEPGTWDLTVEGRGFETQTIHGIALVSGQASTLNVNLKVGSASTRVDVTEVAPLLETATATVGNEVTSQEFVDLPSFGRQFSNYLPILPGVAPVQNPDASYAPSGFNGGANNPAVNGQRQRDNNFTIDGVSNNEPLFSRISVFPPPEAIAEMKVDSGADSGAFSWASGANINLVTKSGTDQYHGDLWEFVQNNDFNARSYFNTGVGAYRYNQFGFTAGGPIQIPKLLSRDKAWYVFGYYEGIRLHQAAQYTAFVPTPAELEGNFAGQPAIYNPYSSVVSSNGTLLSRAPFANNQIPTNLLNSGALAVAKLLPTPNLGPNQIPGSNWATFVPASNDQDNWNVRVDHQFGSKDNFFARYSDMRNPQVTAALPGFPGTSYFRWVNAALVDTYTFSPSFVLTSRYGQEWIYQVGGQGLNQTNLAQQAGTLTAFPERDGYQIIPYLNVPGFTLPGQGFGFNGPQHVYSLDETAQKMAGHHTLAFGALIMRIGFVTDNQNSIQENFSTDQTAFGSNSGSDLASYLLGLPESAGRVIGSTEGDMFGWSYGFYVQDTYRITPKLTLNLGMRWDLAYPLRNRDGSGTFDYVTGQYYWDMTNPITGAAANIRRGVVAPDYNGFQPRFGIAYQLTPKTVLRSSFGIFDDTFGVNYAQTYQGNRGNWPFSFPQTVGGLNLGTPTAFLQNPFPSPAVSDTPLGCEQCLNAETSSTRTPYVEEWSFSIQRQLTPSLALQAAYFGSHGVKLSGQIIDNSAVIPGTDPYQDRQTWSNFPPYVLNGYNEMPSSYNGGSLKLEERYTKNLTFLFAYTYSKAIDILDSLEAGYQGQEGCSNPTRFNIGAYKGPAAFDIRNLLSASYTYDIPVHSSNKAVNAVIGHWQHAGILRWDSGQSYFVNLANDNENNGSYSAGRYTEFPTVTCNPNNGAPNTIYEWFNTSCYSIPPYGTMGSAGKFVLYSQPEVNWDASLAKSWYFLESRRVEFRADFQNLPNAHTFSTPYALIGTSQFGEITGVRQNGRNIQLGLKLQF